MLHYNSDAWSVGSFILLNRRSFPYTRTIHLTLLNTLIQRSHSFVTGDRYSKRLAGW